VVQMRGRLLRKRVAGWPFRAAPLPARRRGGRTHLSDDGAVLLETALAVPLLAAVTVALAWGISLGATSMSLGDAARSAARDLARGVPMGEVLDRARSQVPGASVQVEDAGDSVIVIVERDVSAPGPILRGISFTIHQQVAVPREWT
jgi:hypothetical protein